MTDLRQQLQTTLGTAYTLDRELGGGGMSRVFIARDESLGRDVVIKVLTPELSATLSAERFTREIRLAAALQEPHIVPVHSAGLTITGLPYYTMPFVRGDSLRARIGAGRLPLAESVGILRNVAQALAYAHGQGIIHRDIKPENVLLSSGTAVVTDFGIAKALAASKTEAPGGTITHVGTSLGTPAYMAPEQAAGDDVDARADLYAWGVMAWELLAGRHPFSDRKTSPQLIAAQIAVRPPDLIEQLSADERRDPGTRRLAALVMGCLEKQPSARPASAGELLTTLDAVSTPTSSADRVGGQSSRSRATALGAAVLIAGAAALFVWNRGAAVPPLLEPKRVVVATFENKSGDRSLDPLGAMAADWIAHGLANTGMVDVGGTAADLAARGATSTAGSGASAIQALARDARAGIVISGAYYRQGDSVLFQADFTDANAGKLIQSVGPVAASARSPLDGVERLRQRVIGSLAPLVDSSQVGMATATSKPPNMEAYREYLAGEALFYTDENTAIIRYARAASLDSTYLFPLTRIVAVYANRSDGRGADSVERLINRHRDLLTPFEQAYLDFGMSRLRFQHALCLQAAREMVRLAPKSQFTAYLLGIAERARGHPGTTDSILGQLDPEGGALRGRVFYYDHYGAALHSLRAFDLQLAVAQLARAHYPGRLYFYQGELRALAALGRFAEIDARIGESLTLPPDLRRTAATVAASTVYELRAHGHDSAATALGARVLQRLATRPAAIAATLEGRFDRARVLAAAHRWDELQLLADSLVAEVPGDLNYLGLRGVALAMRGRRDEAERIVALIVAGDHRLSGGVDRRNLAYVTAALGDKARSVTFLDAFEFEADGIDNTLAGDLLRGYPPFEERIKPRG